MDGLPSFYDTWRTASEEPRRMKPYFAKCEDCDGEIYEGDHYYELFGMIYCENCMELNYRMEHFEDETCADCGEEIPFDDSGYYIHGNWYCESCMGFFKSMA